MNSSRMEVPSGKRVLPRALALPFAIVGRSFFPLLALALILGMVLWGPWVSSALAFLSWRLAMRCL
jgi:hypothetical protein